MSVIAMTREMGTLGKDVARHLVANLDLRLVHHELIKGPTVRHGAADQSEVKRFLDVGKGSSQPFVDPHSSNGYMTREEVYAIASRGNVILRGWGAARLLRGIPHIICVRVCAPMEARVSEMMRRLGVNETVARREINRSDSSHTTAFARFFGADWRDPLNYDLVLNTGNLAPEACADILADAAKSPAFRETEASRTLLADRLTEARIAAILRNTKSTRSRAKNVYASVTDGRITLYGATHDCTAARDIESFVRARIGCEEIQNDIKATGPILNA